MKITSKQTSKVDEQEGPAGDPYATKSHEVPLLLTYWNALLKHRVALAVISSIAIAIGVIVTLLMTPSYIATSRIEINRQQNKVTNVEALQPEDMGQNLEFYQTQYSLLEARSLAERVARDQNLASNEKFFDMFGLDPDGLSMLSSSERRQISAADRKERLDLAIEALLENIIISPIRGSSLVDVRFESPNANFSAAIANSWVDQFIESKLDRRFDSTSDARSFLEERLATLRDRLEESERRLVLYADNNEIVTLSSTKDSEGKTVTQQTLASADLEALNRALADATADRIATESEARQKAGDRNALINPALNAIRERRATAAAEYAKLLVQFEPEYPAAKALESQIADLDASIAQEEGRARSGTVARYREALEREKQLRNRVQQLKNQFSGERRNSIQYNIYQREVDTNRQLYDGLLQRYKEIGVAGVGNNSISVVDKAIPPARPSSPNIFLNLALSILTGLGIAAIYVIVAEQIDQTVKDESDLKTKLGIAALGSVPNLDRDDVLELLKDKKSVAWEAYMSIRTSLSFLTDHGVPKSFLLTSTRPNEGKSTSAFALASVLASGGSSVVLIDGDMRNPSLHKMLQKSNDAGLSNFLSGDDNIDGLIQPKETWGFFAISAGPIPPNAAELLTGDRLKLLIEKLGEQFDCVIIDAPPVLGLADIPLLARSVEGVIYTIEANGVKLRGISTAMQRVQSSNVRIFGGIVTKVDSQSSGYGYGYNYQYSYGEREMA